MVLSQVVSVNVVHEVRPGFFHDTAIDKRPVDGPVDVDAQGLVGDQQVDSSHGGPDKAVYAYAEEDALWWSEVLGREVPAGRFGENLRVRGLDVTGALIGERWRVGEVLLEVRMQRTPCQNLSLRMGIDGFHLRFNDSGRVGALLRVVEGGTVRAGDRVEIVHRPEHDVTVGDLAAGPDAVQMQALLDSGVPLAAKLRTRARRVVARQAGTQQ
jgi:MOSC domain-containing protein YiiM